MKLLVIYPEELIKVLIKMGFEEIRQKGSHKTFKHTDGRILTVPYHSSKPIPVGLLNKIIKQDLNLTRDEFVEYFK